MSWSEQEKKLKNKLLNYEEEVNNEALWESLNKRNKDKKNSLLLPVIIAALSGMFVTAILSWMILKEKNENIMVLNAQLDKSTSDYLRCTRSNKEIPKEEVGSIRNPIAHELGNPRLEKQNKSNNPIFKKTYQVGINKDIDGKRNDSAFESQNKIPTAENPVNESRREAFTIQSLSSLPATLLQTTFPHKKLLHKAVNKKTTIIKKIHSIYISGHAGIPVMMDQSVLTEQKTTKAYTPVLAYKLGLGMEHKLTDRISLRGELSYAFFANKLQYSKTTTEQISLNDTSLVTIDELGNSLYEIDKVSGTKIKKVKGEAFNISKAISINILFAHDINPKLNARLGLGYNVYEVNRGINYKTLKKFNDNDNSFRFKINYTIGLSYQLYKNAYLDANCIYSKSQYISDDLVYKRSNFTPFIGISYWLK